MILVVGSQASGKRDYVRSLGYKDSDVADGVLDERPVLYNLQNLIAKDPATSAALLPQLLKKQVVVCNEVGSGVIPTVRGERDAREAIGRLCVQLARKAERVVRLVAGIETIIKG
ncbi:MAG: bifunctional adenosylcobinamide kinase/adenosylcobinamide-phosphate guanylyltransferase [Clostridia bacterium]